MRETLARHLALSLGLQGANSINSKFNIRRKIYDRHKSNSLTNNIVFERGTWDTIRVYQYCRRY